MFLLLLSRWLLQLWSQSLKIKPLWTVSMLMSLVVSRGSSVLPRLLPLSTMTCDGRALPVHKGTSFVHLEQEY